MFPAAGGDERPGSPIHHAGGAMRSSRYGAEADRAAYAALKVQFEKCGDHWIARTDAAA